MKNEMFGLFMILFALSAVNGMSVKGTECDLCEYFVGVAEQKLSSNATETEVEHYLDVVCDDVFGSYAKMCETLVAQYYPELVQYLMNKENPTVVCDELGFCTSENSEVINVLYDNPEIINVL